MIDGDGREREADEPTRKHRHEERRHREARLVDFKVRRVLRHLVDLRDVGHEAEEREQPKQERIGRQEHHVAPDGVAALRAEHRRHRVRIEEERERRADRERRVGGDGVGAVRGGGLEDQLVHRDLREHRVQATELGRDDDERRRDGDVDERILDHRDQRRRAQAARVRVGSEDGEADHERHLADPSFGGEAERRDHHLDADQLQRDVRHGREDAGDRDRERERRALVAAAHEVRGRDVAMLF